MLKEEEGAALLAALVRSYCLGTLELVLNELGMLSWPWLLIRWRILQALYDIIINSQCQSMKGM